MAGDLAVEATDPFVVADSSAAAAAAAASAMAMAVVAVDAAGADELDAVRNFQVHFAVAAAPQMERSAQEVEPQRQQSRRRPNVCDERVYDLDHACPRNSQWGSYRNLLELGPATQVALPSTFFRGDQVNLHFASAMVRAFPRHSAQPAP